MEPMTMMAILAGAGLLKSAAVDAPKEKRQRKLAAETQRYSPWTGLKANEIEEADPIGTATAFGTTGLALGQNMEAHKTNQALKTNMAQYYGQGGQGSGANLTASPWAGARTGAVSGFNYEQKPGDFFKDPRFTPQYTDPQYRLMSDDYYASLGVPTPLARR